MAKNAIILTIIIFCLGCVANTAGQASHNIKHSQSDRLVMSSSFGFLDEIKQFTKDDKLSIFSYTPNENQFKTHMYFAFIFFFFMLIIIKLSSPEYFTDLFSSLFKKNYIFNRPLKTRLNISINSLILDFIFISIVAYFFFQYLYPYYQIEFYIVLAGLVVFTLLQILIILIFFNLFFGTGNANMHLTNLVISNRIIGIIFTPLLFIITYIDRVYQTIGLNILAGILAFIILLRIYRILNQLKNVYNFSFLFIILYICAFELSIYFVCFKLVLLFINS